MISGTLKRLVFCFIGLIFGTQAEFLAQPAQIVAGYYNPADMIAGAVNDSFYADITIPRQWADLDNDGTDDVEVFNNFWSSGTGHSERFDYYLSGSPLGIPKVKFFFDTQMAPSPGNALFSLGDTVDLSGGYWSETLIHYYYELISLMSSSSDFPNSDITDKYAIIRLWDGNLHRYGWIHLDINHGEFLRGSGFTGPDTFYVKLSDFVLGTGGIMVNSTAPASVSHSVYPNPFSGQVIIESAEPLHQVFLSDLSGRLILQKKTGKTEWNRMKIDTGDLPAGIYLLETESKTGIRRRTKLVKN